MRLWWTGLVLACLLQPALAQPSLLRVPDVRQSTNYSCGASALQAVLAYYGIEMREDELMRRLGSDPEKGTTPDAIMRVARELGLFVDLKEGMSLDDLALQLKGGIPVIVAAQAWRDRQGTTWSEEWESGHYMVVIGLDDRRVYFEDPSLLGSRGYIDREEFLQRWHDVDGDGRRYQHLGLILKGGGAAPPLDLLPVR